MTSQPLGVAVIGYGYWGPNLVRNFQRHPGAEVRWVCDRDPARAALAARDWRGLRVAQGVGPALLDPEVELVAVATPLESHYELARDALEAGKHVLVEKPMCADLAQADALVALARERGLRLLVDHTYLFTPEVRYIRRALASGDLGELLYADAVRINLGLFQERHDVVWDLAPHDLSIFLHLVGRAPRSVLATGASHTASGLADVAMIHLDWGGELVANIHVNWLSPVKLRHTIFAGRARMLVYNDLEPGEKIHVYDRGVELVTDADAKRRALYDYRRGDMFAPFIPQAEALACEVDEVVRVVREGAQPTSPGELGRDVVRILGALSRSLAGRGARVELE